MGSHCRRTWFASAHASTSTAYLPSASRPSRLQKRIDSWPSVGCTRPGLTSGGKSVGRQGARTPSSRSKRSIRYGLTRGRQGLLPRKLACRHHTSSRSETAGVGRNLTRGPITLDGLRHEPFTKNARACRESVCRFVYEDGNLVCEVRGMAWRGVARQGMARQGRGCSQRVAHWKQWASRWKHQQGTAWLGRVGLGKARLGKAWAIHSGKCKCACQCV